MRIDIYSCETKHCDPRVIVRKKDGKTFYGLQMRFFQCQGVDENWLTFWAESVEALRVFAIVMQEKVESHWKGTPSEEIAHV